MKTWLKAYVCLVDTEQYSSQLYAKSHSLLQNIPKYFNIVVLCEWSTFNGPRAYCHATSGVWALFLLCLCWLHVTDWCAMCNTKFFRWISRIDKIQVHYKLAISIAKSNESYYRYNATLGVTVANINILLIIIFWVGKSTG